MSEVRDGNRLAIGSGASYYLVVVNGHSRYRRLIACFALLVLAGVAAGAATHRVEHAAHLAAAAHDHPLDAHFDPTPHAGSHPCAVCNWSARSLPQRAASAGLPYLAVDAVVVEPVAAPVVFVATGASPRAPPLSLQS